MVLLTNATPIILIKKKKDSIYSRMKSTNVCENYIIAPGELTSKVSFLSRTFQLFNVLQMFHFHFPIYDDL